MLLQHIVLTTIMEQCEPQQDVNPEEAGHFVLSHNMFTKAMSINGPFLGVCETIPVPFNVEASGYSCLVTLGLGL